MAKPIKIWDGSQWVDVAINVPSITGHADDTTNIHGIANTADLATKNYADTAVSTHNSDSTNIHGITDTANLVYTNDSRLTDSRTPTAHASTHGSAGSDPITIAQSQVTNLTTDLSNKVDKTVVDAKGDLLVGGADNTISRQAVGSDGQIIISDSSSSTGLKYVDYQTQKNILTNGNFLIWQRGTSVTTLNAGQYLADRWTSHQYQTCRLQRVSNSFSGSGPRSQYVARVSSPTTAQFADGSRMVLAQAVESANSIPLRGKTITASFWIRFSSSTFSSTSNTGESSYGNFTPSILFMTSTTDAPTGSTGADSTTIGQEIINGSLPITWTKYKFSATVPNNVNNIYMRFGFGGRGSTAAADTNWYELAEVQIEEGPVATTFEFEPYETTLRKCQRYYYLHASGNAKAIGLGHYYSASAIVSYVKFPQTMRTEPSLSVTSGTDYYTVGAAGDGLNSFAINRPSTEGAFILNSSEASGTLNTAAHIYTNNAASSVAFSAEL